ncbi:GSCOCG00003374001-RA-CDS [Cotesia congregata]|nr:GSCOCG00003374001-RA-CDS [Cotesia congregata]
MNLSWLPDQNIFDAESVFKVELPLETQRKLGCKAAEDVFLEYPWAYVTREELVMQLRKNNSGLECCRNKIGEYKPQWVLVGYASSELTSSSFVVCLSEETRDSIVRRNREITRKIREKVYLMITKTSRCVDTPSEEDKKENINSKKDGDSSRPFFEVELCFNSSARRQAKKLTDRNSGDARDGAIDLLPDSRVYNNIFMRLISKAVNTTLESCDKSVQSYLGYPKNKWTQCDESKDPVESSKDEDQEVLPEGKTEKQTSVEESSPTGLSETMTITEERDGDNVELLEIVFPEHLRDLVDYVGYNSKINIISDDIEALLSTSYTESESFNGFNFDKALCYLINLDVTKGKVISDVSWHPSRVGLVAISYLNKSNDSTVDGVSSFSRTCALVWSLDEPLKPKLILDDPREILTISFCPYKANILVGGAENGQLIFWDLDNNAYSNTEDVFKDYYSDSITQVIVSSASSDPSKSHLQAIRGIRWLPPECKITDNGMLEKTAESSSLQLMTVSEDGSVAVWDLLWQANFPSNLAAKNLKSLVKAAMSLTDDLERLDGVFSPHYRLHIQLPKEAFNLTVLDCCLSSLEAFRSEETVVKFWVGTAQGQVLECTWHGQEFEVTGEENCQILNAACVHDGPVIRIIRSDHIEEVLLSIGGRIFAIWHQDFVKRPVIWRKGKFRYTAGCWSHTPGVFIIARHDGDLECWDLYRKTGQPVHVETISGKLVTGLFRAPHVVGKEEREEEMVNSEFIGICDYNGSFRVTSSPCRGKENYRARVDWFRKFVCREVERKKEFHGWQEDYLANDKKVIDRKAARAALEAKRRHEEARDKFLKEQEELARIKAEKKALKVKKSRESIRKAENIEVMKNTLLEKKGFDPRELDRLRHPLVRQEEEKTARMDKASEKVADKDTYLKHALAVEFPEIESSGKSRAGLGIICMACASPVYNSAASWFLFVATASFIITLAWVFVYLLSLREALTIRIHWILTELLNTGIITILYTIAFIVQLAVWSSYTNSQWSPKSSNIAAGVSIITLSYQLCYLLASTLPVNNLFNVLPQVFGIFNTIAYAAGTYFLYVEHKSNNSQ